MHDLVSGESWVALAAARPSSFRAASESFSEASRRTCAVRFSVAGATSSSRYLRRRVNSSSSRLPISSNLSMAVPFPRAPERGARFRYYRNAQKCMQGGVLALPYRWQYRVDRWKEMFGGFFGGGERRPQLCPACGALVGISATRCHECGANLRFGLAAWSKRLSEFFGGHAPVTTGILILNLIVFAAELMGTIRAGKAGGMSILWGMDGETLYRLGAC